ncbi:hypothetical protein EMGBS15_13730 [Filimonas sp.]|nr:hypothetical protein EMGBS15_13730 [Filimonas sp.]
MFDVREYRDSCQKRVFLPLMFQLKKFIENRYFMYLFFFICWLITILLYYPAHNAMLIDDGVNAIFDIQKQGFSGLWDSYHFDSFYHGYYFILNILYTCFKLNPIGWFGFFSLMHALNTTMLFKTIRQMIVVNTTSVFSIEISFFASFFFLLSPYSAENIVWAATTHYVVGLSILLFSLQWLHSFLTNQSSIKGYLLFLFLNVFALFTFELNFASPFMYLLFYGLYAIHHTTQVSFRKFVLSILLPIVLAIMIYLFLLFIDKGTMMLHDGKGAKILPPLYEIISQYGKHLLRLFSFVQYTSIGWRDQAYKACEHWLIVLMVVASFFSFFIYSVKKKSSSSTYTFLFLC